MGYTTCPKCDGKGEVECPKCSGSFAHGVKSATNQMFGLKPDDPCTRCDDTFVVSCNECGGTGKVKEDSKRSVQEDDDNDDDDNDYSAYSSSDTSSSSDSIVTFPLTGFGLGFVISIIVGFFKGCGLFHFDPNEGHSYLFDVHDAGKGFWIFPIIGVCIGVLITIISSRKR